MISLGITLVLLFRGLFLFMQASLLYNVIMVIFFNHRSGTGESSSWNMEKLGLGSSHTAWHVIIFNWHKVISSHSRLSCFYQVFATTCRTATTTTRVQMMRKEQNIFHLSITNTEEGVKYFYWEFLCCMHKISCLRGSCSLDPSPTPTGGCCVSGWESSDDRFKEKLK